MIQQVGDLCVCARHNVPLRGDGCCPECHPARLCACVVTGTKCARWGVTAPCVCLCHEPYDPKIPESVRRAGLLGFFSAGNVPSER